MDIILPTAVTKPSSNRWINWDYSHDFSPATGSRNRNHLNLLDDPLIDGSRDRFYAETPSAGISCEHFTFKEQFNCYLSLTLLNFKMTTHFTPEKPLEIRMNSTQGPVSSFFWSFQQDLPEWTEFSFRK